MKKLIKIADTLPKPIIRTSVPEMYWRNINNIADLVDHKKLVDKFLSLTTNSIYGNPKTITKENSMYDEYDNSAADNKSTNKPYDILLSAKENAERNVKYHTGRPADLYAKHLQAIKENAEQLKQAKKDLRQINQALKFVKSKVK